MSDDKEEVQISGPSMFCATSVMKTPPARIGKITKDISLPRAVELSKLLAGLGGSVFGLIFSLAIFGSSLKAMIYGVLIFGGAGVGMVTYSPLKGESLWTWLGLTMGARKNSVQVGFGITGKAYVGIAPVIDLARSEHVRIIPGAINISQDSFDERGVLISSKIHKGLRGKKSKLVVPITRSTRARSDSKNWRAPLLPTEGSFTNLGK